MQRLIPVLAAFAAVVAMGAPVAAETTIRASIAIPPSGPNGDGVSTNPGISRDARFVVFASKASNLVPDDTNGAYDVFVRDLTLETTERVSGAGDGDRADAAEQRDDGSDACEGCAAVTSRGQRYGQIGRAHV